jgi:hypothetical protein
MPGLNRNQTPGLQPLLSSFTNLDTSVHFLLKFVTDFMKYISITNITYLNSVSCWDFFFSLEKTNSCFFNLWGGTLGTAATYSPIVPAPDDMLG